MSEQVQLAVAAVWRIESARLIGALTRRLAEGNQRFLGVYADVDTAGVVRVGDAVRVHESAPPSRLQEAAAAAGRAMMRQVQRVLEVTVLRE